MAPVALSPEQNVAEALADFPALASILNHHKTACVGCYLARFCTLREVADTYGFSLATLIGEIQHATVADPTFLPGAQK